MFKERKRGVCWTIVKFKRRNEDYVKFDTWEFPSLNMTSLQQIEKVNWIYEIVEEHLSLFFSGCDDD